MAPRRDRPASRVITMLVRPGSGRRRDSNVLRPMITGLPIVRALKRCHVGFQPPRNRAAGADDAVLRNRDDEDDLHQTRFRQAASARPPVTRHSVQSSIITAPSDL